MPSVHIPVLAGPVVEWLAPTAPGLLVDATLGLGGHSRDLLEAAGDVAYTASAYGNLGTVTRNEPRCRAWFSRRIDGGQLDSRASRLS